MVPDEDSVNTSSDFSNIFNLISLQSSELTALNLSANGYTNEEIFLEFRNSGNYVIGIVQTVTYFLHIRPIRTNGLITSYTRIYSRLNSNLIQNLNWYNTIYFNDVQAGDLLLGFNFTLGNTSAGSVVPVLTIAQTFSSLGNNLPAPTVIRYQTRSISAPVVPGVNRNFLIVDTANSDSQFASIFRPYLSGNDPWFI